VVRVIIGLLCDSNPWSEQQACHDHQVLRDY